MTEHFPALVKDINLQRNTMSHEQAKLNKSRLEHYCKTVENQRQREELKAIQEKKGRVPRKKQK